MQFLDMSWTNNDTWNAGCHCQIPIHLISPTMGFLLIHRLPRLKCLLIIKTKSCSGLFFFRWSTVHVEKKNYIFKNPGWNFHFFPKKQIDPFQMFRGVSATKIPVDFGGTHRALFFAVCRWIRRSLLTIVSLTLTHHLEKTPSVKRENQPGGRDGGVISLPAGVFWR